MKLRVFLDFLLGKLEIGPGFWTLIYPIGVKCGSCEYVEPLD